MQSVRALLSLRQLKSPQSGTALPFGHPAPPHWVLSELLCSHITSWLLSSLQSSTPPAAPPLHCSGVLEGQQSESSCCSWSSFSPLKRQTSFPSCEHPNEGRWAGAGDGRDSCSWRENHNYVSHKADFQGQGDDICMTNQFVNLKAVHMCQTLCSLSPPPGPSLRKKIELVSVLCQNRTKK